MTIENKRKFPRAHYSCFLTLWQAGGFETIMAKTSNVGAGGLLVHLNRSFMIGSKVDIKIEFSNNEIFECSGLVLRCHRSKEENSEEKDLYSTAIAFNGLEGTQIAYLKELVDKLLKMESN